MRLELTEESESGLAALDIFYQILAKPVEMEGWRGWPVKKRGRWQTTHTFLPTGDINSRHHLCRPGSS